MVSRGSPIVVGIALALSLGSGPASAELPQGNLLRNPGAEVFQDWGPAGGLATVVEYGTPGGFPSTADGLALGGGMNFFAGGPPDKAHGDPSRAELRQPYDIPSAATQDVDSGAVMATIGGCLGGYSAQNDSAAMGFDFTGAGGDPTGISFFVNGPQAQERKDVTGFQPRVLSVPVPPDTRQVLVHLAFYRDSGRNTYNDGYADNLIFELTPADAPLPRPSCEAPPTGGGGGGGGGGGTGGGGTGGGGGGDGTDGGGGARRSQFPVLQRSHTARISRSRSTIGVPLKCDAHDTPCKGKVTLRAKSTKLGTTKFSVKPAATKTVRVKLERKAKRRLAALSKKQLRSLRLTAKVTVGSHSATFRLRVTT